MMPGLTMPKKRGGIFGSVAQPLAATPAAALPIASEPPAPQKPKFFGEGGPGRDIAGAMADFAAQYFGGQALYAPAMQQRQMETSRLKEYQQRREDELQDYGARQEIEAKYRPAPQPHRWESNDGSLMELGPDGQPRVAYKDPTPKISWVRADNGDGTFTMVPMGPNGPLGQGGGQPQAAPRPKGKLTPYNGGQTATPSGTFRP